MTTEEQQIIDAAAQTAADTASDTAADTASDTAADTASDTAADTASDTAADTVPKTEKMIAFFSKKAAHFAIAHEIALELQLREAYTNEVLTCKESAVDDNQIDFSELEAIAELLPITDEVSIANECNTRIVGLLEYMLGRKIQPVQVLSGGTQNEIVN